MPSRRRHKSTPSPAAQPATHDPAELFAAALKEADQRDKAARERARQQQEAAARRAAEKAAHADAMNAAHRELELAIQAVRDAKRAGRSTVEADARWKAAKARVIELETGAPPAWAPPADASPLDDGAIGEE